VLLPADLPAAQSAAGNSGAASLKCQHGHVKCTSEIQSLLGNHHVSSPHT
jgi:hypothetical protein